MEPGHCHVCKFNTYFLLYVGNAAGLHGQGTPHRGLLLLQEKYHPGDLGESVQFL